MSNKQKNLDLQVMTESNTNKIEPSKGYSNQITPSSPNAINLTSKRNSIVAQYDLNLVQNMALVPTNNQNKIVSQGGSQTERRFNFDQLAYSGRKHNNTQMKRDPNDPLNFEIRDLIAKKQSQI